ncbi:hypothetical protein GW924_03440 [Candidatus Pacearchaeota archaeon]|nr:hypothetical protein [Candidatus Pacearchaeota archaeon]
MDKKYDNNPNNYLGYNIYSSKPLDRQRYTNSYDSIKHNFRDLDYKQVGKTKFEDKKSG